MTEVLYTTLSGSKFSPTARENLADYCSSRRIGCNILAILEWLKDRIEIQFEICNEYDRLFDHTAIT